MTFMYDHVKHVFTSGLRSSDRHTTVSTGIILVYGGTNKNGNIYRAIVVLWCGFECGFECGCECPSFAGSFGGRGCVPPSLELRRAGVCPYFAGALDGGGVSILCHIFGWQGFIFR